MKEYNLVGVSSSILSQSENASQEEEKKGEDLKQSMVNAKRGDKFAHSRTESMKDEVQKSALKVWASF